mgnify:CR=1 FL=1
MPTCYSAALRIKHALIAIEKLLAATSLILLLALIVIQLIARNFFDHGFPLLDIVSRHLVLFILFMGAALVSEQNNHIKIDLLPNLLSPQNKKKLALPILILSVCVCLIFFWYASAFWLDEFNYAPKNERIAVYLALALPSGFLILGLHFFLLSITGFNNDLIETHEQ